MRSVDERASDLAEGYARGRKEGESAGYTRGYLDGADSAFPKGKAEGEVEGYRRGVAETEQLARAEGAIAGTVSALLASKSGRNIDVALARFGEQLKARPDLVARTREVAVQFGLSRELELFLRHGQFVDPRLAEMFERLERLRRSG